MEDLYEVTLEIEIDGEYCEDSFLIEAVDAADAEQIVLAEYTQAEILNVRKLGKGVIL